MQIWFSNSALTVATYRRNYVHESVKECFWWTCAKQFESLMNQKPHFCHLNTVHIRGHFFATLHPSSSGVTSAKRVSWSTLTWRRKVKGRNGISGVRAANESIPHADSESGACGSGERRSGDTRLVLMVLELRTPAVCCGLREWAEDRSERLIKGFVWLPSTSQGRQDSQQTSKKLKDQEQQASLQCALCNVCLN